MWLPTNPVAPVTRTVDIGLVVNLAKRRDRSIGRAGLVGPPSPMAARPRTLRGLRPTCRKPNCISTSTARCADTALDLARSRGVNAPRSAAKGCAPYWSHRPRRLPGGAPQGVRPPDRPHAGRRGTGARRVRTGRGQGRRTGRATWRSAGRRCSTRREGLPAPGRDAAVARGHGAAATARRQGPTHRDRAPVPRARCEPRMAAVAATFLEIPRPDGGRPRRPRGRLPRPAAPSRSFDVARDRPADHRPRRRVGRCRAGAPRARSARSGSPTDRANRGHRVVRGADRRGVRSTSAPRNVQAGIVPRSPRIPLPCCTRGVPVTLSTDDRTVSDITLTDEYAPRSSRSAVTARAVGHRPPRAGRRVRDRSRPREVRAEFDAWAGIRAHASRR